MLKGTPWFLWTMWGFAAIAVAIGKRRIFCPGVTRPSNAIICRYVPWYEGNAFLLNVGLPLGGLVGIVASFSAGYPVWLRFVGIVLLLATLLMAYATFRMWNRCSLRFTPSTLTIRVADPKIRPGELPRERIEAITPKWIANSVSGAKALQVEIAYRPEDSTTDAPKTVMLGLQLTVEPINLYGALVAWHDGGNADPNQLLDRIEGLLRGRSTAVAHT
ncbi:hypothetical protein [Mycolicibacterium sphagni]|uniref:hypothetical protein n=1 Tax=Mycolicibacterium sphagni TaxID=1786 RepID=UPI0021F29DD7|nr:hypothetical protein [Mycolicibacterium sphagni]MCV7179925.1 hypothetical protein [Mycolicibacterium sphagni]